MPIERMLNARLARRLAAAGVIEPGETLETWAGSVKRVVTAPGTETPEPLSHTVVNLSLSRTRLVFGAARDGASLGIPLVRVLELQRTPNGTSSCSSRRACRRRWWSCGGR